MFTCPGATNTASGHGGEELRRQRESVTGGTVAMARKGAWEQGERRQGLKASRLEQTMSSGEVGRRRSKAGDLGRPEMGKTAWAAMQGSRRCVAPWRGRVRRGGAFGHSGGVERRWWLRLR